MEKIEFNLQKHITAYLKIQYPNVDFWSDLSGIKLPIGQAKKVKDLKSGRGIPDLFIVEPKVIQEKTGDAELYYGLFIEFKKSYDEIYTKNGEYRQNEHIKEQIEMKERLESKGYRHEFVYDFAQGKKIIDEYLR